VAQHRQQHDRSRLAEIQRPSGSSQDLIRIPQVSIDVVSCARWSAGQHRAGVRNDDRVVIGIDDAGLGSDPLSHLVRVIRRRDACADIEELPDALLPG